MTVFRGMGWVKELLDKSKQKLSKIQLQNLTAITRVKQTEWTKEQLEASAQKTYAGILLHKMEPSQDGIRT
ncbi:MAG: hypothetical protein K0S39_2081 [Paenibacillus sp.]|nr:hypothetical protein [Paenibacillus sp.]